MQVIINAKYYKVLLNAKSINAKYYKCKSINAKYYKCKV